MADAGFALGESSMPRSYLKTLVILAILAFVVVLVAINLGSTINSDVSRASKAPANVDNATNVVDTDVKAADDTNTISPAPEPMPVNYAPPDKGRTGKLQLPNIRDIIPGLPKKEPEE